MTIKEKCQAAGIALPTYYFRIKQGMTPEQALSTPNKRRREDNPAPEAAPEAAPEPQPTPAPDPVVKYGSQKSYVFESDWQQNHHKPREIVNPEIEKSAEILQKLKNVTKKVANPEMQPPRKDLATTSQADDDAAFNRVNGGYTALILNYPKRGEYKYQIHGNGVRLYTSSTVKFVNTIIQICDPQGAIGFKVVEG